MKVYKQVIIALVFALICSSASARVVTGKITEVMTWQDGHSIIRLDNCPINGCPSHHHYSLGIKGADIKAEPMLSIALAAHLAGKTATISTNDASCQVGEEKIAYIKILP